MIIFKKAVPNLTETMLSRFLTRATKAVRLRGGINVLITTSGELRTLNSRFRGKNVPTDVLSFPPARELPSPFAGDIAISADIAAQNARRLGHSAAEEIKILVLHGVLHLAGYNHEVDQGQMARKEEKLRISMKLPSSLIKRSSSPVKMPMARGKSTIAASLAKR